jgi:hypothetical protein
VYISRDVVFDETVFPFSALPSPTDNPQSSLHSFPVLPDQFVDAAYSPVLLPNYGAGNGRAARLQLLDDAPVAAVPDVDPACMQHARNDIIELASLGDSAHAASPGNSAHAASPEDRARYPLA